MKFLITNQSGEHWTYDNFSNELCPSGEVANTYKKIHDNFEKLQKITMQDHCSSIPQKSNRINSLRIHLGTSCNYKCSFCIQKYHDLKSPMPTQKEMDDFLLRLDNRTIEIIDEKAKFEFWGGEPLVYYKALKYLIPELRKRYPNNPFSMVSNGTILNDKIIDFLIENRINVTFSHDAQSYFLRGDNPLDDPKLKSLWKKMFVRSKEAGLYFGINCVITQHNTNLQEIERYFKENIHPEIEFGFEGMVVAHTNDYVKVCVIPKQAKEQLRKSIRKSIFEEKDTVLNHVLMEYVYKIVEGIIHHIPSTTYSTRCNILSENALVVNLKGEVLKCHNVTLDRWAIGKIDDLQNVDLSEYKTWEDRKNCKQCPYVYGCSGNCTTNSDVEHNSSCYAQKVFYGIFYEIALEILTGSPIVSIEKIDEGANYQK